MNSVCNEKFHNYKDLINDNSEKNPSQSLLDSGNKKSNSNKLNEDISSMDILPKDK